jgi:hypothetical protein
LIIPRVEVVRGKLGQVHYLQEMVQLQEVSRKRLLQLDGLRFEGNAVNREGASRGAPEPLPNDDPATSPAKEVLISRLKDMEDDLSMQSFRLNLFAENYRNLIDLVRSPVSHRWVFAISPKMCRSSTLPMPKWASESPLCRTWHSHSPPLPSYQ